MPVDELAALYEGLEEPLDALAARYGILRGRSSDEGGGAAETASRNDAGPSGNDPTDRGEEGQEAPEDRDPFPPHREGSDDPRWG
jgi:hypothetical protein